MRLVLRYQLLLLSFVASSRVVDNSIACGTPGRPFGGEVLPPTQNSFRTGDVVSYSCNETDYLLGSFNRTCGPDSKWSGFVPLCLNPSKVNASWEITDYYATGSDYLHIHDQSELLFDHSPGTCIEADEYTALNIRISLNSTRLLEYVRVVFPLNINPKFQLHSKSLLDNKNCVELVSGEFLNGKGYQVTFNCSFKADDGQTWLSLVFEESSGLLSICEIYVFYGSEGKCGTPDAALHGRIHHNLSTDAFNFYCDPGFDLSGYTNTRCSPDRSWIRETPLCVKSTLSESDNMTFGGRPLTVSTTPANSNYREFHSHRYFFVELNMNYLYVGFGGFALLILLIVIIVLKVRGVKRRNALSLQNDTIDSTSTSNLRLPSHRQGSFPLSPDVQEIKMRHLEGKRKPVTTNHYSVAVIPGENNQNISLVGDPPIYENVGTAEPLYEVCFSRCSENIYDDCLAIPQSLS